MGHAVYPMCRGQPPAGLVSGEEDEITNQYFITSPCSPVRPAVASAGPAQYAPGWNDENEDSLSRGASVRVQQVLTEIFLWKRFAKLQLFKRRQYYGCMKILNSVGAPVALIRDTKFSVGKAIPALHVALVDYQSNEPGFVPCHIYFLTTHPHKYKSLSLLLHDRISNRGRNPEKIHLRCHDQKKKKKKFLE